MGNAPEVPAQLAHTYAELVTNTSIEMLKHVNWDRSIIDIPHMCQLGESWMTLIHDLEEAADLCQLDTDHFTRINVIRVVPLRD